MSCGCNNTVQYAPTACNPNFPEFCNALGSGQIQRVIGEDSSYCKYTVPTLPSNSILFYNASTAIVNWGDGSQSNPVFLGSGTGQATGNASCQLQATSPTGQLVAFLPSSSNETQFPIVNPSGTSSNWGTIENIIPNKGIVYKTAAIPPSGLTANKVYQLSGNSTKVVSFDSNGNPIAVDGSSLGGLGVPSGVVLPFAYNVTSGTVPTGWLLCDGSVYQVSAYPSLGALLANTYGGSTGTFAVPNLEGLFVRGKGSQVYSGNTYSSGTLGTPQADSFKSHTHTATDSGHSHSTPSGSYSSQAAAGTDHGINDNGSSTGTGTANITVSSTGGSETRPASLAMVFCIKT